MHIDTVTVHILDELATEERNYSKIEKRMDMLFNKSREAQDRVQEERAKLNDQVSSNQDKYDQLNFRFE